MNLAKKHIDVLIIDDERKFRENTSKRLKLRGFSVHEVEGGEDANKQERIYGYDVVLLDLKMPGMSGEGTLREIRIVNTTGHGIPEQNLSKLFLPFFTTKEVGKGTGLGLSISHGLITSLGGKINVTSEVDKGTTFEILLPGQRGE